jgi:hypothetical protein
MPDMTSLEIRLLAQQGTTYPIELTLTDTQQVFRGQLAGDIAAWSATGDSRADGQALFDALFASADLIRGWGAAHGRSKQLRVQLRIDAPELNALPWELLRDDQDLLAADADSPFSRYLAVSREWGRAIAERPIRVLAVISNPKDIEEKYGLPPADVELEARALQTSIGAAAQLTVLPAPVTLDRLEAELRAGYHILHFVGHGAFSTKTQQAALYLQNTDGNAQRVIDDDFAGMLNRLSSPPHLVVLAACQSAKQSMKAAFSGLGPKLVQIGLPAVIAMQENVTVLSARQFAATFYQRLLAHGVADLALNEARGTLITNGRYDAAVPVLFMRLPNGRLWSVLSRKRVQVIIEQDYADFGTEKRQDLIRVLAALLGIEPDQVRVLSVAAGSVIIKMEMPAVAVNRLTEMFGQGDLRLRSLKITSVIVENDLTISRQQVQPERTNMSDKSKNRSGGVNIGGNPIIKGDVIGRDKKVKTTKNINTGGGTYVGGNMKVDRGSKFVGRDDNSTTGLAGAEIAKLFESIYRQIDTRPDTAPQDKEDLKAEVTDLQTEVAKGDDADKTFLDRKLRNIKRMAPDILEVVVNSFANPALGLATVVRKVMAKAKAESGA